MAKRTTKIAAAAVSACLGAAAIHGTPAQASPAVGAQTLGQAQTKFNTPSGATVVHDKPVIQAGIEVPVNVIELQKIRAKSKKACGPMEVAPGVWVRVDCHAYAKSKKAVSHYGKRKMKLFLAGKLESASSLAANPALRGIKIRGGGGGNPIKSPVAYGVPEGEQASPMGDEMVLVGSGSSGSAPLRSTEGSGGGVDHRTAGLEGPIRNQGAVGSCTAFSLSATLDNGIRRSGNSDTTSPTHVWSNYAVPSMGVAADASVNESITSFGTLPHDPRHTCKLASPMYEDCGSAYGVTPGSWRSDSSLVSALEAAKKKAPYRVSAIESLTVLPANIKQLTQVLSTGADLWVAFKIDGYAWSNSRMSDGVIPDWSYPTGGHAVVLSGWRDTARGKQFLIHNSWGTSWGDKGYAWVSEAMVKKFMHYAYTVKLGAGQKPKELTDDDCSPDELVDGVTLQCAEICPDDSRPMNGC